MRKFALLLLLVPVLLCALPTAALHAGDEDGETARLERRVEMLIDLVAELRAEIRTLRERVAKLEDVRDAPPRTLAGSEPIEAPAVPKREAIPATPIVPAPIVTWADVSGVYSLDKDASIAAILQNQLEGVEDEEMAEMIRRSVEEEFAQVTITLRVEKDGTFSVKMENLGVNEESVAAGGTWTRDESYVGERQRLLLLNTHEDGIEADEPTKLVGTWQDGLLTLEEDDDGTSGYVMIFRRE